MFRYFSSRSLFVLAAGLLASSSPAATLTGIVTDASASAAADARVELHPIAGSTLIMTTSDRGGHFSFTGLAPGQYLLDSYAPGLNVERSVALRLTVGEVKDVPLRLVVSAVKTQVSVTTAGTPQSIDQVSKQLNIVQASEAEQRGIFSVAAAVSFLPGLRVATAGGPGDFTSIQIRGLRTADTAILVDGFPFRDPTSPQDEASAYIGDLLLVDTSRIEVLQGSGSSLYGTNAMAGVVNIVTNAGGGPVHGDVDLQGGGLGLFRGVARGAGSLFGNRLVYSAGVSHLNVTEGVDEAGAVRDGQPYLCPEAQYAARGECICKYRIYSGDSQPYHYDDCPRYRSRSEPSTECHTTNGR